MNTQSHLFLPVLLASLLALSACGQKGPLYLPETEQQAANEASLATDDEQSEDSDENIEEAVEEAKE